MRTQVMTLGAVGDALPSGYPGYGGPDSTFDAGAYEPAWTINRVPMPPTTPQWPQNLLRPTDKTDRGGMSSSGKPVYALYGLGVVGLGASDQPADPAAQQEWADRMAVMYTWRSLGYAILGGAAAGIQVSGRTKSTLGVIAATAAGALFPLATNAAIFFWPKR